MESELGYLCGVLCGSGHVFQDKKSGNYGICIELKDGHVAARFSKCLEALDSEIKTGVRKRTRTGAKRPVFAVRCYSKGAASKIDCVFAGALGRRHWIPPGQAHSSQAFRKGFLRGFFDCKGYVRVRYKKRGSRFEKVRNVRASSVNGRGLFGVRELLALDGVKSTIYAGETSQVLDIEGKKRLEIFEKRVGFSAADKRKALSRAIMFMSEGALHKGGG